MEYINLGGHSGCKILLFENTKGQHYVRKISSGLDYNARLKKQCEKQKKFILSKNVKTPEVLAEGYTDEGLFYFDMQYVRGITLAEYIHTVETGKVGDIVENILESIVDIKPQTIHNDRANIIFKDKFDTLSEKLKNTDNSTIHTALEMLQQHDWSKFDESQCHGDLTLENIIVKNNELYLIDFLDSFYDSWLLDIGTLLQDVQVMWSYRTESEVNMNTIIRLIVFRDILVRKINSISKEYGREIYYALLQKLLRIFPYTKDELTYNFLLQKTQSIVEIIQNCK